MIFTSTKEKNKASVRRFFEEWNKGKAAAMAVMDELYAPDVVVHSSTREDIHGLKDYKQIASEVFSAFPDNRYTFDDMVGEGDKVATRWKLTGTHKGEYRGIPPTNKKVTILGISIGHFAGGKAVEEWEMSDALGFMQQLGIIPPLG